MQKFLKKTTPNAMYKRYESNTAATKELAELKPSGTAAIGPESAAKLYGLEIIAYGIEDAPSQTRFLAITKNRAPKEKDNRHIRTKRPPRSPVPRPQRLLRQWHKPDTDRIPARKKETRGILILHRLRRLSRRTKSKEGP